MKKGILCPNCGKLISSDEPTCPYCHHRRPGAAWKGWLRKFGFGDPARLVNIIIYVNVGMYVISLLLTARGIGMGWNPLTMLSPDSGSAAFAYAGRT